MALTKEQITLLLVVAAALLLWYSASNCTLKCQRTLSDDIREVEGDIGRAVDHVERDLGLENFTGACKSCIDSCNGNAQCAQTCYIGGASAPCYGQ